MENTLKKRFWKIASWFIVGFIIVFIYNILYTIYWDKENNTNHRYYSYFMHVEDIKKNYARASSKPNYDLLNIPSIAQVYEKIASISTKTSQFAQDARKLKKIIDLYNGVIQYEKLTGETGGQEIHLVIGVKPNLFDTLYNGVLGIGETQTKEVTKTDKTNEFELMSAQKSSMEEQLQTLYELKKQALHIQDFITLNGRIFEIEERLRMLGVDLAKFSTENEFCTIRVSLYEGIAEPKIDYVAKISKALELSFDYYVKGVAAVLGTVLTVLAIIYLLDKMRGAFTQK